MLANTNIYVTLKYEWESRLRNITFFTNILKPRA